MCKFKILWLNKKWQIGEIAFYFIKDKKNSISQIHAEIINHKIYIIHEHI
jgi:hypothetical protein